MPAGELHIICLPIRPFAADSFDLQKKMNRLHEKIKDIVDVQAYRSLKDFAADSAATVANYYFTDVTSDLMAKWLDRIATVHTRSGTAFALAGYRGVGKSHFLGVFGAMMSNPELRSKLKDSHVCASAQRLIRRHYPVAYVRRGTRNTLLEELKDAISACLDTESNALPDALPELLKTAADTAGTVPFVLIIDTAFERDSRVARDDGALLGEMAEVAKGYNIFLGIALDDDIAGADGINSAIARSFTIEFLDQEHLLKVLDAHIFPKNNQMRPLVTGLYDDFRRVLPGFRWSEQRFSSLYPLHPAVLETAPFVRLYVQDFSLLAFASEAGLKVMGRPASSLIGLDELFDTIEARLRGIPELDEAFATYDALNNDVVGKIPIIQRLQGKLVLKALMLLSLDGDGASAGDICSAMLIYDEAKPDRVVGIVQDLLEKFVITRPDDVRRQEHLGRDVRYGFRLSGKDSLNTALNKEFATVPDDVVFRILRRLMKERFSDCSFAEEADGGSEWMDCSAIWRGGMRRGRIHWNGKASQGANQPASELLDWEVLIDLTALDSEPRKDALDPSVLYWRPDRLRQDEVDTIRRYYLLLTNTRLRDEFKDQIAGSVHSHTIAVERLWNRKFLQYGKLVIDGIEYEFTEAARSASTLSELFSIMLASRFEERFPDHPAFAEPLGMTEVSTLVTELFSGIGQNLDEVQHLAEVYALPLGLVRKRGDVFVPESEEVLRELPLAADVLQMVNEAGEEGVSLKDIYRRLKQPPHGLVREAQHLILTALVSRRHIEFLTSKGDRINRRSLDLRIIWNDIIGVVKPAETVYSGAKSIRWAQILTGEKQLEAIESDEQQQVVRAALEKWLDKWRHRRVLARFNELPDDLLNTKIWRLTVHAENSFGLAADTIGSVIENSMSLDEALHRIADAFSDSEEEFETRTKELEIIEEFIDGAGKREDIRRYLSICETTNDDGIEQLRDDLLRLIDTSQTNQGDVTGRDLEAAWAAFQQLFSDHFTACHDAVMKSHYLQEKFDEIAETDRWWEFTNLSKIRAFQGRTHEQRVNEILREFRELNCQFDTREILKDYPFCGCSFSLSRMGYWESLPEILARSIDDGIDAYKLDVFDLKEVIIPNLREIERTTDDAELVSQIRDFIGRIEDSEIRPPVSNDELNLLARVCQSVAPTRPAHLRTRRAESMSDTEINDLMDSWIGEGTDNRGPAHA